MKWHLTKKFKFRMLLWLLGGLLVLFPLSLLSLSVCAFIFSESLKTIVPNDSQQMNLRMSAIIQSITGKLSGAYYLQLYANGTPLTTFVTMAYPNSYEAYIDGSYVTTPSTGTYFEWFIYGGRHGCFFCILD